MSEQTKCTSITNCPSGNYQKDFIGSKHDCTCGFESWCMTIGANWGYLFAEDDGVVFATFSEGDGLTTIAPQQPMMLDENGNRSIFDDVDA